jgi:hypothetical protein
LLEEPLAIAISELDIGELKKVKAPRCERSSGVDERRLADFHPK